MRLPWLIRRSLETSSITTAKLRLSDLEKDERQRLETQAPATDGKMTFGEALAVYRKRLDGDVSLKPASKEYREERIAALLKSWPTLENTDVRRISKADCLNWAADYQKAVPTTLPSTVTTSFQLLAVHEKNSAMFSCLKQAEFEWQA